MRSAVFKPSNPISILLFIHDFKKACDPNEILKGDSIPLFQYFIKDLSKVAFTQRMCAIENDVLEKE